MAVGSAVIWPTEDLLRHMVLTPAFVIVVGFTLLLERLIPAQQESPLFSPSFAQDLVWFFYETVMQAVMLVTYVALLTALYHRYCSGLTITAARHWPAWERFVVAALLFDLLLWLQHYCHHRFAVLWNFHTVHHSQRRLNFFTDFRYHIVEYLVRNTWLAIPFLILDVHLPVIAAYALLQRWYTRFYHGNIRTSLGPFRHVLVTPQSHRIHHSFEPRHRDKNFGSVLAIWDQFFGTQYYGYDEYPETGIVDADFPHESRVGVHTLFYPLVQMAYPFRRLFRGAPQAEMETQPIVEASGARR